jgi:hypothetical protein
MGSLAPVLVGDEIAFDRDLHAYLDEDGSRRMSVTQALKVAGVIDFSMVPFDILEHARNRGSLVHEACAIIDRGESLDDLDIPDECEPYIDAWLLFCKELRYIPDPDWIEQPMIVELFGARIGMMPDSVGWIDGVLTVIERKACASKHPAWALQTAGYYLGLQRVGLQVRNRLAVQLQKTAKYKLDPHDDPADIDSFGDIYRTAAWKLKHRLASLD